jgi:ubiquinone/menaquinone biosynthesis C-methylase UbiE
VSVNAAGGADGAKRPRELDAACGGAGLMKRVHAWLMARHSADYELKVAERKRALFAGIDGDVLEIGPGAGPNLAHLSPAVRWIGIEPNPHMWPYLRRAAAERGMSIVIRRGIAERIEAEDRSVDAVIGTLVLCGVRDQDASLAEVRRVLRPGGRYAFVEHVAAPRGTGLRRAQEFVRPLWKMAFDGCEPSRETWGAIERAGFASVQLEHVRVEGGLAAPHIFGVAIR